MDSKQFTAANLRTTRDDLTERFVDYPELLDPADELVRAADARREALKAQTSIGEMFGEEAGIIAAERDGLLPAVLEGSPGPGTVDQAFITPQGDQLVVQEAKGPSAGLGTARVTGPDGTLIPAQQGSEAYLRQVLRSDTRLLDAILADPALRHGLLDGTTSIRYRLVQPDPSGHIKVTEFIINSANLDIQDWLGIQ